MAKSKQTTTQFKLTSKMSFKSFLDGFRTIMPNYKHSNPRKAYGMFYCDKRLGSIFFSGLHFDQITNGWKNLTTHQKEIIIEENTNSVKQANNYQQILNNPSPQYRIIFATDQNKQIHFLGVYKLDYVLSYAISKKCYLFWVKVLSSIPTNNGQTLLNQLNQINNYTWNKI